MIVELLTEHHLEFLSLKGGCRGSSESSHVKMSNCWKFHAAAQMSLIDIKVRSIIHETVAWFCCHKCNYNAIINHARWQN